MDRHCMNNLLTQVPKISTLLPEHQPYQRMCAWTSTPKIHPTAEPEMNRPGDLLEENATESYQLGGGK
jgi:hypothetical protein